MTVLELLQSTTAYFQKRGIESPRLNAEQSAQLLADLGYALPLESQRGYHVVIASPGIATSRPVIAADRKVFMTPMEGGLRVAGTVEFAGQTFVCDKRVLVPRPETEQLVELLQSKIESASGGRKLKILDVGTGSGVIALSLAAKFPEAEITATEISDDALTLAQENAERLGLTSRLTFRGGDLLTYVTDVYDLIVANLPYVAATDRATLSREVLHDPEVALFGGERGDELVRKLVETAPAHLAPGGLLALELGAGHADDLAALMAQKNYHDIKTERDYAGVIRFLFGRYG